MSTSNRLGGLVQRKGAAPRPAEMPQRGEPAPAPVEPTPAPVVEPKKRSLTLKLSEAQYQRLRAHAFKVEQSHQDIMERALMIYLDSKGAD